MNLKKLFNKMFPPKTITRGGKPYLIRWTLFTIPRLFSIKLHKTLMSDSADLHDHPWSYISIMLRGGYWEYRGWNIPIQDVDTGKIEGSGYGIIKEWYGPGSILIRKADRPHRLEIPEGKSCWTLIFTSYKWRKWGFETKQGWIPFEKGLDKY